ncbi:MAG TPA: histidine kinase [Bacteroidales bacterium]|nr:histidine kinase [Bacteroidales bacterium]
MLKRIYKRHLFFFNMLAVLIFLTINRTLDSFAWLPSSANKIRLILVNYFFEFISIFPFIFILILSYRWTLKRKQTFLLWVIIVAYSIIIPTLVLLLSSWLAQICGFKIQNPLSFDLIEKYTPGVALVVLFLTAAYFLTHLVLQAGKQRETAHKTETLGKDVQLKMLRYQINPHFLFNVLNSIYTLIDENTEKAKKLVLDMSEYYRHTLNKQQHTVTIEKEVESIMKYLEIQKTRFEDEFNFEISVDDSVKSILIPSFIIHLLVENAVKYGTKSVNQTLIIRLTIIIINRTLQIKVSNTGKLVGPDTEFERNSRGTGNGLENLKSRLALYYMDNYTFSLNEENGWVEATIEIKEIVK